MESQPENTRRQARAAPPKISVIVLAYNVGPYIQRCLDSLRRQTFQDFEIIVVDDGSEDETPTIIDANTKLDTRIISAQHPTNQGTFRARITGADRALGEYFCMVDGDDVVEADYLNALYSLASQMGSDVSECGMMAVTKSGRVKVVPRSELSPDRAEGVEILHMALRGIIWHTASNKLISRELYLKARPLLMPIGAHITVADDKLFMLPLLYFTKSFARTDRILYWYRVRAESSTRLRNESSDLRHIHSTGTVDHLLAEFFRTLKSGERTQELLKTSRRDEIQRCLRLLDRYSFDSPSRRPLEETLFDYYARDFVADEIRVNSGFFQRLVRAFSRYSLGVWLRLLWRYGRHSLWGLAPRHRHRLMNMIHPMPLASSTDQLR